MRQLPLERVQLGLLLAEPTFSLGHFLLLPAQGFPGGGHLDLQPAERGLLVGQRESLRFVGSGLLPQAPQVGLDLLPLAPQILLASLAEGLLLPPGLLLARKGRLLLSQGLLLPGDLLLGLGETGGLFGQLRFAARDFVQRFALPAIELFLQFGLAALQLVALPLQVVGIVLSLALLLGKLGGPGLQIGLLALQRCLPFVQGALAVPERFPLDACRLQLRLQLVLLGIHVALPGLHLLLVILQILLGLPQFALPAAERLLLLAKLGLLRVQGALAGLAALLEQMPLLLQGLDRRVEFPLAAVQFDPQAVQDGALLFELALIGRQLDLFLLEPGDQARVLGVIAGNGGAVACRGDS